MGPIYKYGLENNKQSKKPLSFAFQTDAEKLAASYGRDIGDTAIEQNKPESQGVTVQDVMEGKIKKSPPSPQTSDIEARSVREGKLSREKSVKDAKKEVKAQRDASLSKLDKKKKDLNIDKNKVTSYDDSSNRKQIRAEKRRKMRDIRNKEMGDRRADRAARQIKKIGDRNNLTQEEATEAYETRKATLSSYNKNSMQETADEVAARTQEIQDENERAQDEAASTYGALGQNKFYEPQKVVSAGE